MPGIAAFLPYDRYKGQVRCFGDTYNRIELTGGFSPEAFRKPKIDWNRFQNLYQG